MAKTGPKRAAMATLRKRGSWLAKKRAEDGADKPRAAPPAKRRIRGKPVAYYREVIRQIPGYDPFATAGNCTFDAAKAKAACEYFPKHFTHYKGEYAGKPFRLKGWQAAIIGNLFGWYRPDGTRRYREAYIEVPRKNGKTHLAAGISDLLAFEDHEPGAEVYCAAADAMQAGIVFECAKSFVLKDAELSARVQTYRRALEERDVLTGEPTGTILRMLSAAADTKHGLNSHGVVIDELHAQPDRELVDVLLTSTGSRRQPLIVYITTAGHDRTSICRETHDRAIAVRDEMFDDPSFLPVIHAASLDDDWCDEKVWAKANPNLGVSVSLEYLRRESRKARESAAYENTFKRLHLNIWTEQAVRWLAMEKWDACGQVFDASELAGRVCFGGLDLASKLDMTAFDLVFPPIDDDPLWYLLPFFWVPESAARERERRNRWPYFSWIKGGFLRQTEGDVTDYDVMRRDIGALGERYDIRQIAFDRWNASQLSIQLQGDGFEMVECGQGFKSFSEPSKELERLMVAKLLRHGGHPVLRWMASNVAVRTDEAGNIKPDRDRSAAKIDGIVAAVMAIDRAILQPADKGSVYDTRGLIVI